jgi:murein DD-endopeptidase MepM/ murein hydrolase activator NlpD
MTTGTTPYFELRPPRATAGEYLQQRQRQRESDISPWTGMIIPLPRGTYNISRRGFGRAHDPMHGGAQFHGGHDIQAAYGTPILAPQDGVISDVLPNAGGAGNFLKMKGMTYGFGFMHLSRFAPGIRNGVPVKQGQIIGFVGSTGHSTGPHLHYEVYDLRNGERLDPKPIALNGAQTITQADATAITRGQIVASVALKRPIIGATRPRIDTPPQISSSSWHVSKPVG